MLLDLPKKKNTGDILLLKKLSALPKNFWFILLGALVAQLILISVSTLSGDPMGDVRYTYEAWTKNMAQGNYLLGLKDPWVYPFVAQVPMWLAYLLSFGDYMTGWLLVTVNLNMLLIAYLLGWGSKLERYKAAWFLIGCIFLVGPVAIGRLEVFSLALTVLAVIAFLENRDSRSIQFFNLATWIKVSPMAALASLLIVLDNKKKFFINLLIATAVIVLIGLALGGDLKNIFSFVGMQSGRGVQVESSIAILWLVQILFSIPGSKIYYDDKILTFQVSGFGVTEIANIMTLVQFGALAITLFLGYRAKKNGVDRNTLFAWVFLTATLDLLVFNKVGSPQYELWLVGAAVFGILAKTLEWRLVTWLTLITSGLSWLIFPIFYGDLLDGKPLGVSLLILRNLGVIAVLVYGNMQLVRLGKKEISA